MILLPQGIRGDFDRKSERGFEPCQALFQRTLFQRPQKDTRQITHSIGYTRIKLSPTDLVDGVSQEERNVLRVIQGLICRFLW
jgi:hypothetical protein